ncbi:sensor histidine kinase [Spirilliplanes yamanashiensis]|uniref:histidine kinase n=1 Tax=Spirilliplanes yamanashiensis TaxID=42233 RepID=A0A8J4DM32_9ACTN|nr:histidine kinase [Spirilliplanes yamanashiensis]MDP9816205.1 signal transduction histidine kinase [Spirilliplanes yamanashiensis]GIJ05730.1 two-component sensor histidine kinase [Spirilliplanes yamanashiensis]
MDALNTLARVPRRPPRADVALAALLLAWAVVEATAADGPGRTWERVAFAVGVTAPLVVRRRAPLTVLAVLAAVLAWRVLGVGGAAESTFPFPSMLVVVFSIALHASTRPAAVAGGAAALAVNLALYPLGYYVGPITAGQVVILGFFIIGAWTAGYLVRLRADQATAAEDDAARRAADAAADAVTAERARIARELHDVVAHSLSIVAVQAGAAEELIALDPDLARRHIAAARRTAREALTEMRHVLDVQRADAAPLAPQPTLERVPDLVADSRAAGLPVTLTVDGDRGDVPAGVDLAGFRIVQEALTNVRRHAGAAPTAVTVHYADRWIDVRVRNTAGPLTHTPTSGGGRGVIGMRERAKVYGGTLDAGPHDDGYEVRARLPRESA